MSIIIFRNKKQFGKAIGGSSCASKNKSSLRIISSS